MTELEMTEAPFLLTRAAAAKRYSLNERTLDEIYKRDPEFPMLRVGKKVLVHREGADAYFVRNLREVIETGE